MCSGFFYFMSEQTEDQRGRNLPAAAQQLRVFQQKWLSPKASSAFNPEAALSSRSVLACVSLVNPLDSLIKICGLRRDASIEVFLWNSDVCSGH